MRNSTEAQERTLGDGAAVIAEILAMSSDVLRRFEPDEQAIKQCMAQIAPDPLTLELIKESTYIILCVLQEIGNSEPVNGITIAKQGRIPKGTVSKMTQQLLAKGLISKESLPNNKKEILFRLTPAGRELYLTHRVIVQQVEKSIVHFLQKYEPSELLLIRRVLRDILETSFLSPVLPEKR